MRAQKEKTIKGEAGRDSKRRERGGERSLFTQFQKFCPPVAVLAQHQTLIHSSLQKVFGKLLMLDGRLKTLLEQRRLEAPCQCQYRALHTARAFRQRAEIYIEACREINVSIAAPDSALNDASDCISSQCCQSQQQHQPAKPLLLLPFRR
eukprot:3121377-Rhodomonas_salina.7